MTTCSYSLINRATCPDSPTVMQRIAVMIFVVVALPFAFGCLLVDKITKA